MDRNSVLKTTVFLGIASTAIANNNFNIEKDIDWEDFLNKFEEYKKNILQQCEKSIVEIYGVKKEKVNLDGFIFNDGDFFDTFPFFDKEDNRTEEHLTGTKTQEIKTNGFIISNDGFILTSYSDIKDYKNLVVKLNNKKYQVKDINYDVYSDLALLKIDATNLDFLPLNKTITLKSSKNLYCLGCNRECYLNVCVEADNKKGEDYNNKKDKAKKKSFWKRNKKKEETEIEKKKVKDSCTFKNTSKNNFDGAICVINVKGELVGLKIKYGKYLNKKVGKFSSIIPSAKILEIVEILKKNEMVKYDLCGINLIENNEQIAKDKFLQINSGCYIASLDNNVSTLGFEKGDIIIGLNGYVVNDLSSLYNIYDIVKNTELNFTVKRREKNVNIKVNFGIMSDIKLEIKDNEIKTKDFLFSNSGENKITIRSLNNNNPELVDSFVITKIDHIDIFNIKDLLYLIKKRLNDHKDDSVKELTFLIEGYNVNKEKDKRVLGIKIS